MIQQYGPGLPEEQIMDEAERNAVASKTPSYTLGERNGVPVFRAVTPYVVSHDFHGTDCLACHQVEVGSVNGASDIEINLSADFKKLHEIILWLVVGQIAVQLILFFLIRWVVRRFVVTPLNEAVDVANRISEGDLAVNIEATSRDETGQLLSAMHNMIDKLRRRPLPPRCPQLSIKSLTSPGTSTWCMKKAWKESSSSLLILRMKHCV